LVEISVSGLGVLRNKVAAADTTNAVTQRISSETSLPVTNLSRTSGGLGLTTLTNGKQLDIRKTGSGNHLVVFIHGLGGDKSFYSPLITSLGLKSEETLRGLTLVEYDFEGHGLSPTSAASEITVSSLAADLHDIITLPSLALSAHRTTIVAHSMGCLVATLFASLHPDLVQRLVLLGPPPIPVPAGGVNASVARAAKVRAEGMREVTNAVSTAATSEKTKAERPLAFAAVQMSLLSQDPEGYAKGCIALASGGRLAADLPSKLDQQEVLVVAGEEDKVSPKAWAEKLSESLLKKGKLTVLPNVGHWHCFEDVEGVARAVKDVLV
jgi:pimeloyl-ACP methyl ester carboxylesterase